MSASLAMEGGVRVGDAAAKASALPAVDWGYQPWRERPGRSSAGAVAAFGMCVLTLQTGLPWFTAALLCIVFVSMLAPTFTPARCRVDAEGVALRGAGGWVRRDWNAIRKARLSRAGLFVSPLAHAAWLDAWRGLFLPFPASRSGDLAGAVRPHLERHGLAA